MSGHTVVVFGAGGFTGHATVFDQIMFCNAKRVNAVDLRWANDWDACHRDMERFKRLLGDKANRIQYFDNSSPLAWIGVNVAIFCTPHAANLALTKEAIERGVPCCDLGGCPEVVEQQAALAKDTDVSVSPECGLSPGFSNIYGVDFAKEGNKEIRIRCGVNPHPRPDPKKNPLVYQIVYSPEGVASGYCGHVPKIANGEIILVPALDLVEQYDSEFDAAPTSHNSRFVVEHLRSLGVMHYDYQTLRYRGHYQHLVKNGYTLDPQFLAQTFRKDARLAFDREKDRDRATLIIEGDHDRLVRYDVYSDPVTKFTALERTTAWGISIVAHHMVMGLGKPKGFATPEQFVDTAWCIREFDKRLSQSGYGAKQEFGF